MIGHESDQEFLKKTFTEEHSLKTVIDEKLKKKYYLGTVHAENPIGGLGVCKVEFYACWSPNIWWVEANLWDYQDKYLTTVRTKTGALKEGYKDAGRLFNLFNSQRMEFCGRVMPVIF